MVLLFLDRSVYLVTAFDLNTSTTNSKMQYKIQWVEENFKQSNSSNACMNG